MRAPMLSLRSNRQSGPALLLLVIVTILVGPAAVAQEPTPHASFRVGQARYLSTDSPHGTIEIDNTTDRAIGYSSTSVTFLIRDATGKQYEDQWIKTISHIPTVWWIQAGEQRSFDVGLPKCDVLSDPCVERVAIKLWLSVKDGSPFRIVTNERTYTFDPDPTATFRVDGLRDNRPLFISQGEARDSVFVDGTLFDAYNNGSLERVLDEAHAAAREIADRLARFLGTSPLSFASGLIGDGPLLQISSRGEDLDANAPFITFQDFVFDEQTRKDLEKLSHSQVDLRVRSTDGFLGANETAGPVSLGPSSPDLEYLADGLGYLVPPTLRATIEADRPQVYAIAATTREASERHGYAADAVAFLLARDRAQALASQLGMGSETVSIVAQYQPLPWSEYRTLIACGVGMTAIGESSASWHGVSSQSSAPATTTMGARTPYPTVSPRAIMVPTPVPAQYRRRVPSAPPDLAPIDVPDPSTSLSAQGEVQRPVLADELRVSIAFARGDRTPDDSRLKNLPNPAMIERLLRSQPVVRDAAVNALSYAPLPVGYQIIVHAHDAALVPNLIATVRSRYAPFHTAVKYGVSTVLSNCSANVIEAQRLSVDQATHRAVDAAVASGRRLRKLVLAAAGPVQTGDFCLEDAQPDAADRARVEALHLPGDQMVTLRVPVTLTFRTYPKLSP
jgi:hypothetical protein